MPFAGLMCYTSTSKLGNGLLSPTTGMIAARRTEDHRFMAHRTLPAGTILKKRYQIERLIKSGGFAAVYVAIDLLQRLRCAVKETFDPSVDGAEQFRLEAEILAGVKHPRLPGVWDYFQDSGGLYLVMEYIDGDDLEGRLDVEGTLPEEPVREWAIQICEALTALHKHDPPIIHRDIKPANIKITSEGQAVLVDFGIAKLYEAGSNTQVAARAVTDGFSPLEQYGQGSTDPRSDIYALGATLYNLLTGVIPPDAPSRVTAEILAAPHYYAVTISPMMEQIILRALSLRPGERFQSADEMSQALWASGHALTAKKLAPLSTTGQLRAGGWVCIQCQTINPPTTSFCIQCGAPTSTIELEQPTQVISYLSNEPPTQAMVIGPSLHHVTHGWEAMNGPPGGMLVCVAGRTGQGLVACGENGLVLVHNDGMWVTLPTPTSYTLRSVAAATAHVWAVGEYGTVVHFTSGRWQVLQDEVEVTLRAIALDSPTSGWIAGDQGVLIELRDHSLESQTPRRATVRSIAIDDVGEGWAVGDSSLLLRLKQGSWKTRSATSGWGRLAAVAHRRANEAWAVGESGVILRIDDNGWEAIPPLGLPDLHAVAFNRRGEGWAVGDLGALAWFDGDRWSQPATPSPLPVALRSIGWLNDDEAWAVGEHGVVVRWRR